jgi:hypothetical protein
MTAGEYRPRSDPESGIALIAVLSVMVLLLSIVGAALLFSGVNLKITSNYQTGVKAFYAADTGIHVGLSQLQMDQTKSTAPVPATKMPGADNNYYESEAMTFKGTIAVPGYSLGSGTGYNQGGYGLHQYQMNMKGYVKPGATELATRRIEAQGGYGPVPR